MAFPASPINGQPYTSPSGVLYTYSTATSKWNATVPVGTVTTYYVNNSTIDPTASDDASTGYVVGSVWVNTVTSKPFVCVDSTIGAAVWADTTTASGGGVGGVVATDPVAPTIGQIWYNSTANVFKTYVNVLGIPTVKQLVVL